LSSTTSVILIYPKGLKSGRLSMRSQSEQAQMFMSRAMAFEEKAAQETDRKQKKVLLCLAEQYRRLADQATKGPYD
jgi:hypothetical protein